MVQKSGIIRRFLAGTYSDQILYLNSISEPEKIEDKTFMLPREWSNGSIGNTTIKSLKLWLTIYSVLVETTTIHFLVPNSTKNHQYQKCVI